MDLDPTVQVAVVSVFATGITTLGIILVAVINNRKERSNAANAGVESALDKTEVLTRMLSLISENERKEAIISSLRTKIELLELENSELKAIIRLKGERDDAERSG